MALKHPETTIHWNYYLALEQDFGLVTRYIEPCKENEKAFSIELSRLIMASAQESDVLFKSLCKNIAPAENNGSINRYYEILKTYLPGIFDVEVFLERYAMSSTPFSSWLENTPPEWWTANNKIKHHRTTEFHRANMANAVESISALLVLNLYYCKSEIERINQKDVAWFKATEFLVPDSKYFYLNQEFYSQNVKIGASEW